MTLSQLKQLVADAEKWAARKGKTPDEYPVYVISGPNVRDIRTYSPADWNRGGVALILGARQMAATDEWGRPRCQRIGTYVDADEDYQCALVEGHEGECDPLPEIPEDVEPAAAACPGSTHATVEHQYTAPAARCTCGCTLSRYNGPGSGTYWAHALGQIECPPYDCACGQRHNASR